MTVYYTVMVQRAKRHIYIHCLFHDILLYICQHASTINSDDASVKAFYSFCSNTNKISLYYYNRFIAFLLTSLEEYFYDSSCIYSFTECFLLLNSVVLRFLIYTSICERKILLCTCIYKRKKCNIHRVTIR